MSERVDFFMPGEGVDGKPHKYTACGLDYVYLLNGVLRENDPDYGEIITIKDQADLHKSIGLHIVEKRNMSNKEFRFLRKAMGLKQRELAWELEVDVQTVANYEKQGRIPGNSQKLMRWQFLLFLIPPDAKANLFSSIMKSEAEGCKRRGLSRERGTITPRWHERGQLAAACG